MSKVFANKMIVGLFFSLVSMNVCSYVSEDIKKIRVTKETYYQLYNSFEQYIFKNRSELWWGRKTHTVLIGAKILGYNEFTIKCISLSYSFFDRDLKNIKNILKSLVSDEYIYYINVLLEKCNEKPGDLNWLARVSHEEGKRFEQEKIHRTGRPGSVFLTDTFVAAGLFVRYWVEKRLPF